MDAATAVAGLVGLTAVILQASKLVKDFTFVIRNLPEELQDIETDLKLVQVIIDLINEQCKARSEDVAKNHALDMAVLRARQCVTELHQILQRFSGASRFPGRQALRFLLRREDVERLRSKVLNFKTVMVEINNLLDSTIHVDTNNTVHSSQQTLKEVDRKTDMTQAGIEDLRTDLGEAMQLLRSVKLSQSPQADLPVSGMPHDLTANPHVQKHPEHLPTNSKERSISIGSSATLSNVDTGITMRRKFPMYQYRDNSFQFLATLIFTRLCNEKTELRPLQQAAECFQRFPTPKALSHASQLDLEPYFRDPKGEISKSKRDRIVQLLHLAQDWLQQPPKPGAYHEKSRTPRSEISHLRGVGATAVDTWTAYCRDSFYRGSGKALPKCGWREVKENGREKSQRLAAFIEHCENEAELGS